MNTPQTAFCDCMRVRSAKVTRKKGPDSGHGKDSPSPSVRMGSVPLHQAAGGNAPHQCISASPRITTERPKSRPRLSPATGRCIPSSRSKRPSKWEQKENEVETVELSPGYLLSRGKNHFSVTLMDEFLSRSRPQMPEEHRSPDMKELIKDLQEQICKLTALLVDEQKAHQLTRKTLTREAEEITMKMLQQHQHKISELQEGHNAQIDALRATLKRTLESEKISAEERYVLLEKDYEFLKSAFCTYKDSVMEEMESTWLKRENDWREKIEKEETIRLQHNQELEELQKEKEAMREQFEKQMAQLMKEYQQRTEALNGSRENKETTVVIDTSVPGHIAEELKALQDELAENKTRLSSMNTTLKQAQRELQVAKGKLIESEQNYEQRISEMDNRYRNRIHGLMNENADLGRRFFFKCEELLDERSKAKHETLAREVKAKENINSELQSQKGQGEEPRDTSQDKARPFTVP
ncbi:flagellum-associated coiled-coil domain-containing protein 1-like [Polyodon spathula]|uniref:flagellum-associated coiled-coil domain-containing protein 1-like n=1 Tax=Polyodon spathula TaxID=7913 RepID=UPI001B7DEA41|nr:flagellum-associated coiled-coil domain-containing protein 1-like [Polyodon spathula]